MSPNTSLFSRQTVLWWRGLVRLSAHFEIFTEVNRGDNDWVRGAIVRLQAPDYGAWASWGDVMDILHSFEAAKLFNLCCLG